MQVITPIFLGERLIGVAYMHAHVMDIGGVQPGSWGIGARDCFGESFRLPFVKYIKAGEVDESICKILRHNTRLPDMVLNDIHCLAVASRAGATQFKELVARYGVDRFERLVGAILDRTEAAARTRLSSFANATYEQCDWMEHNGHVDELYAMRGQLTVSPEGLRFVFTGAPQTDGFINGTPASTAAMLTSAAVHMLFYDIPLNEGVLRTIQLEAQPGTVVSALEPAPVSSTHIEAGMKVHTIAVRLLGQAMNESTDPEVRKRAHAPFAASVTIATFAGVDKEGVFTVFADMSGMGGGGGGGPVADGPDVSCSLQAAGIRMPDIESMEEAYPMLYLWRRLGTDSGGPGKHRGGVGLDVAWVLHGADQLNGVINSACGHIPAMGAGGGMPGGATLCERIDGADVHGAFTAGHVPTRTDVAEGAALPIKIAGLDFTDQQVFRMRLPGGGGWGDPLDRDPAAVAADIRIGAVSRAQALSAYGVVLADTETGYDASKTTALRVQLRARRMAGASAAGAAGANPGACGHLHDDAHPTLLRSADLAERMGEVGVYVSPYPGVRIHEAFCSDCGASLEVSHTAPGDSPATPASADRIL